MKLYKLLAELLDYPGEDMVADLRALVRAHGDAHRLVDALDPDHVFPRADRDSLAAFVDWLLAQDPTEVQSNYVQTFDMVPEHSLHLTHHLFGDDKNRGPALIDLSEYYKSYELQHIDGEIPDFLPLMLEFVSLLDETEAGIFLADAAKVFDVLAGNLEKSASPYAILIRIIENQGTIAKLAA